MNKHVRLGLRISILSYAVLHFITYFYHHDLLFNLLAVSGCLLPLFAALFLSLSNFKLPLFLFITGLVLMLISDTSFWEAFQGGLTLMQSMIGLLVIIPMIGWVLNDEPYIESIMRFAYRMINTSRKLYFGIISFTQIISYFLMFGAIPMMYQFVNKMVGSNQGEALENFKSTAVLRAFALSTIWVVTIPSFVYAVETLEASLWVAIIQGFFISMVGIGIAMVFSHFEEKHYGVDLTTVIKKEMKEVMRDTGDEPNRNQNVLVFFILFVTLFGSIFLLHIVWPVDLLVQIPIVIFVWTLSYYLVKRNFGGFFREGTRYVTKDVERQSYQLSIMVSAGMMINGLNQTGFGEFVVSGITTMQEAFPSINFLYFLPFIVIFLGFIGLGPLTVMVLVAGILTNISLPYPPELIVIAITSGSVISILLSPLIMPVIVLSGSNGLSGFKNGIKFNLRFAIVFYVMVQVYVQLMIQVW
ncbi:hypothetical protein [Salinibacillus xinjiangensis]|uniref:Permease n=1 Tax=Salinibacillus xinjiangensis TaxID=1229268 RepID=A0A6G1X496_9BACI|nr:hypothetical protein [Salinibacillus xinjiangensis]MRG85784.1 hypothetical protein [Salinibacillus xinjiangensis]